MSANRNPAVQSVPEINKYRVTFTSKSKTYIRNTTVHAHTWQEAEEKTKKDPDCKEVRSVYKCEMEYERTEVKRVVS